MANDWKRNGFPERKRGLGRGLSDIYQEPEEPGSRQARSRDLPTQRRPFGPGQSQIPPSRGEAPDDNEEALRWKLDEMKSLAPDFGPYFLEALPDKEENRYRGPTKSTRLRAHQFVPDDLDLVRQIQRATQIGGLNRPQFMDYNIHGKIYVRFIKYDTLWVYGHTVPIPLSEYRNFRASPSKGKSVKYLETYGHGQANTVPAGVAI